MAFASLTIDVNARLANIERDMGRMAHMAEKESQRTQAAFARIGAAATALAVALPVGAFTAWIKSSIDAADNMRDMAIATGTSVEALASYQLAAEQSGTDVEALAKGMGKLSVFMATNAEEAKKLGITAKDPALAFAQLAGTLEKAATPADRNAIAMRVLGKSYADLMPLLSQGRVELESQAAAAGPYAKRMAELAEQADKFNDQLAAMKQKASEAGIAIANKLLPYMNAILERWDRAIQLSSQGYGFIDLILGGINPTGKTEDQLSEVNAQIAAIQIKLKDIKDHPVQAALAMYDEKQLRADISRLQALRKTLIGFQRDGALAAATAAGIKPKTGAITVDGVTGGSKAASTTDDSFRKLIEEQNRQFEEAMSLEDYRIAEDTKAKLEARANKLASIDAAFAFDQDRVDAQERAAAALGRMRDEMLGIIDPIQQYRDKLEEVDRLLEEGLLTPEQATAARFYWQEQIDGAAGFGQALKDNNDFAERFGDAMSHAFEDAILNGKKLDEVLRNLALRELVLNPITGAIKNYAKSFALSSLWPFAEGGIMTGTGPLPLHRYATGGIATRPQLALFGEGSMAEAFVPLPDGRHIPVKMQGGGVVVNQTVHIDARGADAGVDQKILLAMRRARDEAVAAINSSLARGGATARLAGVA